MIINKNTYTYIHLYYNHTCVYYHIYTFSSTCLVKQSRRSLCWKRQPGLEGSLAPFYWWNHEIEGWLPPKMPGWIKIWGWHCPTHRTSFFWHIKNQEIAVTTNKSPILKQQNCSTKSKLLNGCTSIAGWFITENATKMDD